MARWDVTGVDHKTGSERTIRVSGDTERAAMLEARAAGILSTRVTLIPGEGGPPTAEAKPEQAPAVVLSYSGQYDIPPTDPRQPPSPRSSRDRYPDVRIAGGVIEVGAVLIGIGGVVALVLGIAGASRDHAFETVLTGIFMIVSAAVLYGLGAGLLILADIGNNSFRDRST